MRPALSLLRRQQENGCWRYPAGRLNIRVQENYDQFETYRNLGFLVEKYGFTREHNAIVKAAGFLFTFQTGQGDFRGIYGNQYSPNYSAGIMELLIKAGYQEDPHIAKGFKWLLSIRQEDGGWAIPTRTLSRRTTLTEMLKAKQPFEPDRSKPFSHCITGVVLRAFAAHPQRRASKAAITAGRLLKSRFFKPDKYPDRKAPSFWTSVSYPFWFTDLVSSLDSLSMLGFRQDDPDIQNALNWLRQQQQKDGTWKLKLLKTRDPDLRLWVSLAICRILKRFSGVHEAC